MSGLLYDAGGCVTISAKRRAEIAEETAFRDSLDEASCCSFEEWRDAGYYVVGGMKSMFRDIEGIPQFTKEQVNKRLWGAQQDHYE